ncbi:hypothetical protein BVRB_6g150130 [Beta vulgaris subsp. vulgaris]|nr:hypothetical protein BVRB_6g150130 [Beta vulgaris subsp. vulgaris]
MKLGWGSEGTVLSRLHSLLRIWKIPGSLPSRLCVKP